MSKFEFSIRSRLGQKIDGLTIMGQDQADAERKLMQMYRYCEVISCQLLLGDDKQRGATSVEDIMSLISKEH